MIAELLHEMLMTNERITCNTGKKSLRRMNKSVCYTIKNNNSCSVLVVSISNNNNRNIILHFGVAMVHENNENKTPTVGHTNTNNIKPPRLWCLTAPQPTREQLKIMAWRRRLVRQNTITYNNNQWRSAQCCTIEQQQQHNEPHDHTPKQTTI